MTHVFTVFFSLCLAAYPCIANAESPRLDPSWSVFIKNLRSDFKLGSGRINGVSMPIGVVSTDAAPHDLRRLLMKYFEGRRTILEEQHAAGSTLLVSNVSSKQCPLCLSPTLENEKNILSSTLAITEFGMSDDRHFFLITPAEALLTATTDQKIPMVYEGFYLQPIAGKTAVLTQTTLKFHTSAHHRAKVKAALSCPEFASLIDEVAAVNHLLPTQETHTESGTHTAVPLKIFTRGESLLSVRIERCGAQSTEATIYEIKIR